MSLVCNRGQVALAIGVTTAAVGEALGGRRPVEAVIQEAKRIGYREIRLHTLLSMTDAVALYRNGGFEPMEPNYPTPVSWNKRPAADLDNQSQAT